MVVILVWAMAYQWTHMGTMTGGVAQHQHGRPAFRRILCPRGLAQVRKERDRCKHRTGDEMGLSSLLAKTRVGLGYAGRGT